MTCRSLRRGASDLVARSRRTEAKRFECDLWRRVQLSAEFGGACSAPASIQSGSSLLRSEQRLLGLSR